MLVSLHIRNYILIDSLDITFPEGLIIITGQTGAGKSIMLGALSLLSGAKADVSMISQDADSCVVEAEFKLCSEELSAILKDEDIDADGDEVVIRRVLNRSGRSRCFVNDCPVSVQLLQELPSYLIDIHSQHQTLLLADRKFQMELLDFFAGNAGLREDMAGLWNRYQALKSEAAVLDARIAGISAERDYNEAQLAQLEKAALREGELEELEIEQRQLANAEEIKSCLSSVLQLANPSPEGEIMSLDASLKESARLLSKVSRFLPSASDLSERMDSCRRELDDIISEISDLNDRTDVSESRLEEVENRMSLIYGLLQKHSCADVAGLFALRDRLSEELMDSSMLEEKRMEIAREMDDVSAKMDAVSAELHMSRVEASGRFADEITQSIRSLELQYAVFEVGISDAPVSSSGKDMVTYRFSASGRNPVDLSRCASGGEMSRIMLALKDMRARFSNMPTMIFDEIDTGVSGSVADKMGSMICGMGDNMQVFAITHLPQVAAKGKAHYLVTKEIDPSTSKAVTTIKKLSDRQRVLEVARMLSGASLTDAAIANAESLLSI